MTKAKTYITADGKRFTASCPEDLVKMLRLDSRDPRENDLRFRVATARAASIQSGFGIRSNTADQLVEDLISTGLLQTIDWPKCGEGATICHHSDRTACTIVDVSHSGKTMFLQVDEAILDNWKPDIVPGGFTGHCRNNSEQRYKYRPRPEGTWLKVRLHKTGIYKAGKEPVIPGRHHFHDYNF